MNRREHYPHGYWRRERIKQRESEAEWMTGPSRSRRRFVIDIRTTRVDARIERCARGVYAVNGNICDAVPASDSYLSLAATTGSYPGSAPILNGVINVISGINIVSHMFSVRVRIDAHGASRWESRDDENNTCGMALDEVLAIEGAIREREAETDARIARETWRA